MQVKQESLNMCDKVPVIFFEFVFRAHVTTTEAFTCILRIATDGLSCCPAGVVCVEGPDEWCLGFEIN